MLWIESGTGRVSLFVSAELTEGAENGEESGGTVRRGTRIGGREADLRRRRRFAQRDHRFGQASDGIEWVGVRHEETAAFAAGAEAALTGQLAVCAGSCGPGNLHLINGLYDAHRSRVPVLAIAAHIPSQEIGSAYFQETHPEMLFRECSQYCELVSHPAQMPRTLEIAIQTALSKRGVAVVVLPGDTALLEAENDDRRVNFTYAQPHIVPRPEELDRLAAELNRAQRVTILAGAGCADAHDALLALAGKLQARSSMRCVAKNSLSTKIPMTWE